MKTDEERGEWGAWLRRERLKRNLSPEEVRAMLAARGYRVGESSYAEWESGYKKPTREARPHLIALWGSEPTPLGTSSDPGDLAGAIREQTAVMRELVEAIREDRSRLSPEAVTLFLRQLASEGLLLLPDTAPNSGVLPQPSEVQR